jgi:hypothetical protein
MKVKSENALQYLGFLLGKKATPFSQTKKDPWTWTGVHFYGEGIEPKALFGLLTA